MSPFLSKFKAKKSEGGENLTSMRKCFLTGTNPGLRGQMSYSFRINNS